MVILGHLVGVAHVTAQIGTGACGNKTASAFMITDVVGLQGILLSEFPPTWNPL